MRILIVSDIHANPWALDAVERDSAESDFIICAGDTVGYGPEPGAAIQWLRDRQAIAVRGNHDHAVAFGADPKASPAKQQLALAMRDWTRIQIGAWDSAWLERLPISLSWEMRGTRFALFHATPLDPLYDYRLAPQAAEGLVSEMAAHVTADALITGHTHLPFVRTCKNMQIVNPGSLGQPLDGDPRAAYAVWDDGKIQLRRVAYDQQPLLDAVGRLPLPQRLIDESAQVLRTGRIK